MTSLYKKAGSMLKDSAFLYKVVDYKDDDDK